MNSNRLTLVPKSLEDVHAMIAAMSPSDRRELSADWLARLHASTSPDPWLYGFSMVDRETAVAIGQCGFKGPPDDDGIVEIAYGVHPDQREKGYATEAAEAMLAYAFADPRVRVVRAHTLPESNASQRVLTKCAFALIGEVVDPEDGLVWRWEKHRPHTEPFKIRVARSTDHSGVLALVPRLRAFGPSALRTPEALDAGEVRTLERFFAMPPEGARLFVAEGADGGILGMAYAERALDYFTRETHGHLGILAVSAEAEGRGVGRALIRVFEQWATGAGYRFVTLNVFATNARASAFYEKAGYSPDTIRYAKDLDSHE